MTEPEGDDRGGRPRAKLRMGPAEVRKIGRRTVLGIGGAGFDVLITTLFHRYLARQFITLGERLGTADARSLFATMFSGRFESGTSLLAGRRDFQAGLHPENAAATATLRRALSLVDMNEEIQDVVEASQTDDLILVGGTNSNIHTMVAWEASGSNMDRLSRPEERGEEPIIPFRWYPSSDRQDRGSREYGPVGWKMEGQGTVRTINWALHDILLKDPLYAGREKKSEEDRNGDLVHRITSNYLVVTRIPNFLHPDFMKLTSSAVPYLTVFQGMHGPGTRAIELLLTGKGQSKLSEARASLLGAEEYQLLFQVSGIGELADGHGGIYHAFHDISLEGVHRLEGQIDPARYERAHRVAMRRLSQEEPWLA